MAILSAAVGAALILIVLGDAFETIILPRRVTRQVSLARIYYRFTWLSWARMVRSLFAGKRQATYLSFYGPLSLIVLLMLWATGLIIGFGLVHWGSGSIIKSPFGTVSFGTYLYLSGTTFDQLTAVQTALAAFQASVTAELDANQCGHDVGSGKVITLNLTLQEGVFYDNGCVVKATPITTGRSGLRTPTGDYSVFYKTSPFTMVSPWPLGSPDWYPTTVVQWVLEFADGYFLHDAYWENQNAFGPGSDNDVDQDWASHGCVHIPTALMPWLYNWTPLGAPVIITN